MSFVDKVFNDGVPVLKHAKGSSEAFADETLYGSNVELYDIAFDWNLTDEVNWLLALLGKDCKSILEPGCGSGRMLKAIAERGVAITGLDISKDAIAYAKSRIAGLANATATLADMTSFDLKTKFDGAICPVNTLAHLSPEQFLSHLKSVRNHLHVGSRYLVQVAVRAQKRDTQSSDVIEWEASRGDTRLRISVAVLETDFQNGRELHRFRLSILEGSRAGKVFEEDHWMTLWTPESWQDAIAASPFTQVAQYDGELSERPKVKLGQPGNLMWHELTLD